MTASELRLVATTQAIHTSAHARLRQRIAEERRVAAMLTSYAKDAIDAKMSWMLVERPFGCLCRAKSLELALHIMHSPGSSQRVPVSLLRLHNRGAVEGRLHT